MNKWMNPSSKETRWSHPNGAWVHSWEPSPIDCLTPQPTLHLFAFESFPGPLKFGSGPRTQGKMSVLRVHEWQCCPIPPIHRRGHGSPERERDLLQVAQQGSVRSKTLVWTCWLPVQGSFCGIESVLLAGPLISQGRMEGWPVWPQMDGLAQ